MNRIERPHGAMLTILLSLWLCIVGVACQGAAGPPEEPVYVLVMVSAVEPWDDDGKSAGFIDTSLINTTPLTETVNLVTGKIVMNNIYDPEIQIIIKVEKVANGKKEKIFSIHIDLCKEIIDPESDFKPYLDAIGFPRECPFDAGSYPINDLEANMDGIEINSSTAGNYLVTLIFAKCEDNDCDANDPVPMAGVTLACVIEPLE